MPEVELHVLVVLVVFSEEVLVVELALVSEEGVL